MPKGVRKIIVGIKIDPGPERSRGARGFYGVRRCKRCDARFTADWPSSAYCPRCRAPGHVPA